MASKSERKAVKIVILGAGRLGGALHRALSRCGYTSTLVSRPKTPSAQRATEESLGSADVVFFCVPDGQIAFVAAQYAPILHVGQVVAHCAGSMALTPLTPVADRGIAVGSMHPLCAIASPETSFLGIHAAIAGGDEAKAKLREIAKATGMTPFDLNDADRSRYHAAAVMASNCVVALASYAAYLFESCGMDQKQAVAAMMPLMRSAVVALEQKGLPWALTGPIARGDADVVLGHLNAMNRPCDGGVREVYADLSLKLVEISGQMGTASAESLEIISRALDAISPTAESVDDDR